MDVNVLVINLDRSPKRYDTISKNLQALKLPFTRIAAVDGLSLDEATLNQNYSKKLNQKEHFRPLKKGEIACYLSHRKACQYIVDNQLDCALVIEDDTILFEGIQGVIGRLAPTHQHWDLIKLCHGPKRLKSISKIPLIESYELTLFNKVPSGAWVQLIYQQGARKFLKMSEKFGRPVDQDLRHWWDYHWRILGISKSLASHVDETSDIDEFKGQRKKRDYSRLKRTLLKWRFAIKCQFNTFNKETFEAIRPLLNNNN